MSIFDDLIRQRAPSLSRRDFSGIGKSILELGKDILRAPGRALTSVVLPIASSLTSLITGKRVTREFVPETKFQKAVFGDRPIKGIFQRTEEAVKKAEALGASKAQAIFGAPLFIAAGIIIDLLPIGGAQKQVIKRTIKSLSTKFGDDIVEQAVRNLGNDMVKAGAKNKTLDALVKAEIKKITAPTLKEATKLGVRIDPSIRAGKEFAGNINLDKITNEESIRNVITNTSYKVEEAGRGVQTNEMTRRLADQLGTTPKQLTENWSKGTAFNAEEMLRAEDLLKTSATKIDNLGSAIRAGDDSSATLIKFQQAFNQHVEIQRVVSGAKAEVGRALQVQKEFAKEIPFEIKAREEMMKSLGGRDLTEEIAKRMALIDTSNPIEVAKFIRGTRQVKFTDQVHEYWLNSILSNPITHIVNNVSNNVMAMLQPFIRTGEAVFSAIIQGRKREVKFGEVPTMIYGQLAGIKEGIRSGINIIKNGIPEDLVSKLDVKRIGLIKGKKGEAIRIPTKALVAADEFWKAISGTGELYARAYRQAIKNGKVGKGVLDDMAKTIANPSKEIIEEVKKIRLEATFQADLGSIGQTLMKARDIVPGARYVVPFVKTPTNIFKESAKLSPLGFIDAARKILKLGKEASIEEVFRSLSKATIGSGIAVWTVMEVLAGNITGGVPAGQAKRDAFYREGKQPFSIKIDDHWYSYRRIEPLSTVISLVAGIIDIMKEDPKADPTEKAKAVLDSISKLVEDRTFLSGLSLFMNTIADPSRWSERWIAQLGGGFVPFSGTQAWLGKILDETVKNPDGILERIRSRTPYGKDITPKRNVWGEEIKFEGSDLFRALSPFSKGTIENDPVDLELKRLDMLVGFPSQTITLPEELTQALGLDLNAKERKIRLTNEEYDIYLRISGKSLKRFLDNKMPGENYQKLSDDDKIKAIGNVTRNARDEAKMYIIIWMFGL